ncbi:hypothetical protein QAD02_011411 [Eretmocerus hayati]|uniref:Uncharacterized protein n=1 Tax=Eretmocerus hayati TaxID=131215 RepID=A0ACC2NWE3_9HYME|nr:hypothetical protein QAD02_011411 [Eretmocerus hayati]
MNVIACGAMVIQQSVTSKYQAVPIKHSFCEPKVVAHAPCISTSIMNPANQVIQEDLSEFLQEGFDEESGINVRLDNAVVSKPTPCIISNVLLRPASSSNLTSEENVSSDVSIQVDSGLPPFSSEKPPSPTHFESHEDVCDNSEIVDSRVKSPIVVGKYISEVIELRSVFTPEEIGPECVHDSLSQECCEDKDEFPHQLQETEASCVQPLLIKHEEVNASIGNSAEIHSARIDGIDHSDQKSNEFHNACANGIEPKGEQLKASDKNLDQNPSEPCDLSPPPGARSVHVRHRRSRQAFQRSASVTFPYKRPSSVLSERSVSSVSNDDAEEIRLGPAVLEFYICSNIHIHLHNYKEG